MDYSVEVNPSSVFSVDLDGDRDNDLAVANGGSFHWPGNTVSVFLNNGDGTFATNVDYTVGSDPQTVFSVDLDGDGDNDLAVANLGFFDFGLDTSIVVYQCLLNNGDGTFAPKVDYGVEDYPFSVCSVDLDGDGDNDLAVANLGSDNVSVLLNNGDGTFAPKVDYGVEDYPFSVCSVDLDGDGDNDLAVANLGSDNVSVLLNNGDGTFAPKRDYGIVPHPFSLGI